MIKKNQINYKNRVRDVIDKWNLFSLGVDLEDHPIRNSSYSAIETHISLVNVFYDIMYNYQTYTDEYLENIVENIEQAYIASVEMCNDDLNIETVIGVYHDNSNLELFTFRNVFKGGS